MYGIGISKLSLKGGIENENQDSSKIIAKITDASKLDKVIKYLNKEDELKYFEFINENNWNEIYREDFLEVTITPRFSKLYGIADLSKKIRELSENFQQYMDAPIMAEKDKKALDGLESLKHNKKSISCVFSFEDNKYPLIGKIDEKFLKVDKDMILTSCTLLCKVQKKIQKGNNICIDEIFEEIKKIPLNREQRRKMPKNLANPEEMSDKINGPAFVVVPIALYQ